MRGAREFQGGQKNWKYSRPMLQWKPKKYLESAKFSIWIQIWFSRCLKNKSKEQAVRNGILIILKFDKNIIDG